MGFSERILFFKETKNNFRHTGSITPSTQFLAKAIVSEFAKHDKSSVILEVGPGTGVFTREIAKWIGPGDEFHICEINTEFTKIIQKTIQKDPLFRKIQNQIQIFNQPVQTLTVSDHYDFIISSLPLNNFDIPIVMEILSFFESHLKSGGILSYFEYAGIRQLKLRMVNKKDKLRLKKLDIILQEFISKYQYKSHIMPLNVPPAHVHHLKF